MSKEYWGVAMTDSAGREMRITLRWGNTNFGDLLDRRFAQVTMSLDGTELWSGEAGSTSSKPGSYNSISVWISSGHTELTLWVGGKKFDEVCRLDIPAFCPVGAAVWSHGEATVSLFAIEAFRSDIAVAPVVWDMESLDSYLTSSSDPLEGYWSYLDRDNDPRYARLGGKYRLAMVKSPAGGYVLIYIGGAEVEAPRWRPGMLKGHLRPTIFVGHYTLEWVDAVFRPESDETSADITDGAILTLNFPLMKTKLRFAREVTPAAPAPRE